jgi:hypothetical protein
VRAERRSRGQALVEHGAVKLLDVFGLESGETNVPDRGDDVGDDGLPVAL